MSTSMLAAERQNEILKHIRLAGIARTNELADALSCAEETVRRDLDKLAENGLIARTHGGASSLDERSEDLQHHKREERFVDEKKAIGVLAAQFVQAHETLLLDESSTALAAVDCLPKEVPLTIVTSSLLVAQRVATNENHTLIQLGGTFDPVSLSFTGCLTELALSRLNIDRFFFSCKGIDALQGASEPTPDRVSLKQLAIKYSRWNCALADLSKVGIHGKYYFAPLSDIDLLITNRPPQPKTSKLFQTADLEIKHPS